MLKSCIHEYLRTYRQSCILSCAILSRNIKRDCMADLCKYLWPANKRVLAEPKRKVRISFRERELGKAAEEGWHRRVRQRLMVEGVGRARSGSKYFSTPSLAGIRERVYRISRPAAS